MSDQETDQVYVKTITKGGLGFGIVLTDGEDAVIPPHVVEHNKLQAGDTADAILTPNAKGTAEQREAVPWQVAKVLEVSRA